jgi:signal peptide peptidase SppA
MKTYPRLFQKLFCSPLMVMEPVRYSLEAALLGRMGLSHSAPTPAMVTHTKRTRMGEKETEETVVTPAAQSGDDPQDWRVSRIYETYGNVAVIELVGVIDKHISDFEMECYGGYDISDFDNALIHAAADPDIETVVLSINSPGGSVTGVPESAARVAGLAKTKEVHAFVDSMACSAAYYIASQADHIAAAPSAILGSIGVYMTMVDATRAAEMEGYKVDLITAGKFKAMGSPFKPLSDEERGMLQQSVNDLHAEFKGAVKSGRRAPTERGGHQTVADSAMEGQWFDGKASLSARLVDELTGMNLDEYVTALL